MAEVKDRAAGVGRLLRVLEPIAVAEVANPLGVVGLQPLAWDWAQGLQALAAASAVVGAVLAVSEVPVIASGGVGSLDDLRALQGVVVADRVLAGVIVGRALADARFTLADALAVVR